MAEHRAEPRFTFVRSDRWRRVFETILNWFSDLGIPIWIVVLTVIVVVAPFVLPPVKDWKSATVREKFSVSIYAIAVGIVLLWFVMFFKLK